MTENQPQTPQPQTQPQSQPQKPPAAPAPVSTPAKERMNEEFKLAPAVVKGLAEAKLSPNDVLNKGAVKHYPAQKLFRVVTREGQRLEISEEGKWLNPPKPKPVAPAKPKA